MTCIVDKRLLLKHGIKNFILVPEDRLLLQHKISKCYCHMLMHTGSWDSMEDLALFMSKFELLYVFVKPSLISYQGEYQLTYKRLYSEYDNLSYIWKIQTGLWHIKL